MVIDQGNVVATAYSHNEGPYDLTYLVPFFYIWTVVEASTAAIEARPCASLPTSLLLQVEGFLRSAS